MHPIKIPKTIMTIILFIVILGMQNSVLALINNPMSQTSILTTNQELKKNQPVIITANLSDLFRKPPKRPRSIRQKNPPRISATLNRNEVIL
jgi:hypothetical protein